VDPSGICPILGGVNPAEGGFGVAKAVRQRCWQLAVSRSGVGHGSPWRDQSTRWPTGASYPARMGCWGRSPAPCLRDGSPVAWLDPSQPAGITYPFGGALLLHHVVGAISSSMKMGVAPPSKRLGRAGIRVGHRGPGSGRHLHPCQGHEGHRHGLLGEAPLFPLYLVPFERPSGPHPEHALAGSARGSPTLGVGVQSADPKRGHKMASIPQCRLTLRCEGVGCKRD
jgi:hypothetical protein